MASADLTALTIVDVDLSKLTRLVGEHAAAMSENLGIGQRVGDNRRRIAALEQSIAALEGGDGPPLDARRLAADRQQLDAAYRLQRELDEQHGAAVNRAGTLHELLTGIRSALLQRDIAIEDLEPFASARTTA